MLRLSIMKILLIFLLFHFCKAFWRARSVNNRLPGSPRRFTTHLGRNLLNKFMIRPEPKGSEPLTDSKPPVPPLPMEGSKMKLRAQLRQAKTLDDVFAMFPTKGMELKGRGKQGNRVVVSRSEGKSTEMSLAQPGLCLPVLQCHDLRYLSHVYDGEIWPSQITYKKCGGCCMDHQEAVPVGYYKPKKLNIVVISYSNPHIILKEFSYVEHKECACVCKVKKQHCKPQQKYDADNCRCVCDPDAKKECGADKQWSNIACGCVCKFQEMSCSPRKVYNKDSCKCQCRYPRSCGGNMEWDESSCSCIFVRKAFGVKRGFSWDRL